jgi:hypothetical protein
MSQTKTQTATYTKLRDGSWGVRVPGSVTPGQSVVVTKKSGETKQETILRVLASFQPENVSLCSIQPSSSNSSSNSHRRRSGRYECEECGDMVTPGTQCWETGMEH